MSLTTVQYLALSQFAYNNFSQSDVDSDPPTTISDLLERYAVEHEGEPVLEALSEISNWKLVGFQANTSQGFAGMAFQAPNGANGEPGEIVFSFRGTEEGRLDYQTDFWLAVGGVPAQFTDVENFYNSVTASHPTNTVSFTGHSLGGALAQYMTYYTDGDGYSETFNAISPVPSIMAMDTSFASKWDSFYGRSVDHVNSNDWVGMYHGRDLGETRRYLSNSDLVDYTKVNFDALADMLYIRLQMLEGTIGMVEGQGKLDNYIKNKNSVITNGSDGYALTDTLGVYYGYASVGGTDGGGMFNFSQHGLDLFLEDDANEPGTQYVMTSLAGPQQGFVQLRDLFQFINAMHVLETARSENETNYNQVQPSSLLPGLAYQDVGSGVTYFRPDGSISTNTGTDTYSNATIAYAKYTVSRLKRSVQTGSITNAYNEYRQAQASNIQRIDPLILDLDGDGIETTHINNSNAFFDLDLNGFAENTSWAKGDDGFLVLDRNQDGIINNATELFGDRTLLNDGVTYASSGFQALAEYDDNQDGLIDAGDSIYSLLRVWQDADGNGVSAASELKSLLDLGIVSIALSYLNTGITDAADNIQVRVGEFTRTDGTTSAIGEYLFNRDTANSIDEPIANLPPEIAELPNIQGAGNVASLHKAMADDTSGDLQDLVEAFIAEDDVAARNVLMEQILIKWTGSDTISPTSRGGVFDAQKLAVMEKFFGIDFSGNPTTNAVALLTSSYTNLVENMYVSLIAETHLKNLLDLVEFDTTGNISFNWVRAEIDDLIGTDQSAAVVMLGEFARIIRYYNLGSNEAFLAFRGHYAVQSEVYAKAIDFAGTQPIVGTSGDDSLSTSGNQTALDGGDGNDYLYANTTSNVALYGGAGNDTIYGSAGDDILSGGTGDDYLEGKAGNDTYVFGLGYGVDTIYDADETEGNTDTIQFLANVDPDDVIVRRAGLNLELSISGTTDKLIVENYFGTRYKYSSWYSSWYMTADAHKIERIQFADGTVWSIADVKDKVRLTTGTAGDDSIVGFSDQDDIIEAGDGADYVYTYEGNDLIHAGAGNDYIDAGAGDDVIRGEAGDDSIYGRTGNDILDGGAGTDYLEGNEGNDTYIFGIGYGVDTIYDADETEGNTDTIQFLEGIDPEDIAVRRVGLNLEMLVNGTDDRLIVENYFGTRYKYSSWYSSWYMTPDAHKIEQVKFSDGTIWSITDVMEKARLITGTDGQDTLIGFSDQHDIIEAGDGDDTVYGYEGNDLIHAGAGNDYVDAGAGNDVIHGEGGDDTIYGRAGNDILDGGAGTDYLEGNEGDDTYHFGIGYGVDTIYDADETEGNQDRVVFGAGVAPEDILVKRAGTNLELSIVGTDDKLIVENYFGTRYKYSSWYSTYYMRAGAHEIEQFIFSDNTVWTPVDIAEKARYTYGTSADDGLTGFDDQNDIIAAGAGDDSIYGLAGDDVMHGDAGNDMVDGGAGNDTLYGNQGNDTIYGRDGNDILDGGAGDDYLEGNAGNDTYVFGVGYGTDTIYDADATEGNIDKITFLEGVNPEDVKVVRSGTNLELSIAGTTDKLIVENYFGTYYKYSSWYSSYHLPIGGHYVEEVHFANGTVWYVNDIKDKVSNIEGTAGDDYIYGFDDQNDVIAAGDGNDTIYSRAGNDTVNAGAGDDAVYGESGDDILRGEAGNDSLFAGDGNDLLDGGAGNDILEGGTGDDTYIFGHGYGVDTIYDNDSTEGNVDKIVFLPTVASEDVRVRRVGANLELSILGTADKLIVENYFSAYPRNSWYSSGENSNKIEVIEFADGTTWDIATILEMARFIDGTEQADTIYGFETNDVIAADDGDDIIYAQSGNDIIDAGDGNDTLYGEYGDDTLRGKAGNDTLHGGEGNDILDGGTGNDLLEGGAGDDTYIFGIGYGIDTIYDSDSTENNQDTIQFLDGVDPQSVTVTRSGDNLELSISGTSDKLIVERYFSLYTRNGYYAGSPDSNKIEQIKFADGTIWSIADVKAKARHVNGTSGDDYIYGFGDQQNIIAAGDGNDIVYAGGLGDQIDGGAGNDSLFGSSGNDTLTGGTGNDLLEGNYGNDRYIFAPGFGNDTIYDLDPTEGNIDTIQFLEGIDPGDVVATRAGDDLLLTITGTDDSLRVDQYFSQYNRNGYNTGSPDTQKVEVIEFANGTVWSISDIKDKVRHMTGTENSDTISGFSDQQDIIFAGAGDDTLYASGDNGDELHGEAGNDSLYGSYGSDLLDGGTGNDILEGGTGNDVYLFGLGYGTDTIYDNDTNEGNHDTIQFLLGIAPEDVVVKRNGDNLELSIVNATDKLIVQNYFSGYYRNSWYYAGENANKIEAIMFADGTSWDIATVLDKARHLSGTEENDVIYGFSSNDVVTALAGDDTVYASSGNDIVHGGDGNDALYGDSGDDQLFGDAGNDTLYGADGNDTLDGGTGNDLLEGSYGNDTYVFGIGYGQDTIYDNDTTEGNLDIVNFLPGVDPADVSVRRNGDNLELRIAGTEDMLIVERYFSPYARNSWYYYGANVNKVEEFHFADGTIWDVATVVDKARFINGTEQADTISAFETNDVISAGAGDDTIYAQSGNDTVNGGDGNDTIYGDYGDDILRGDAGNDSIFGGEGNDLLDGGTGNDILEGNYGNDTYVFGRGYGVDTIYDNDTTEGNLDVVTFLSDTAPSDVSVRRNGDNLELRITGTEDMLVIERYFSPYARNSWYYYGANVNKVEEFRFTDGTVWDIATIADKARFINGTEEADTISGFDTNDVIVAGAGDDTIYAQSGNDTVNAGDGNDVVYGDYGDDILRGEAGNDTIYGGEGNDTLDGGIGNDLLEGGYGNDTYIFGIGYGVDTIYDNDTTQDNVDVISFQAGIAPEDVLVKRNGDNLELHIVGTTDTLIVERYFSPYARNSWYTYNVNMNKIEQIVFDNGTIWDIATIADKARYITGTEDSETISGFDTNDVITAGAGDDTVYASSGDDIVHGNDGNDVLYGDYGNDQLFGGAGNDTLYGGEGSDVLDGGTGNDLLEGSSGDDTYSFGIGYGVDTIYDNDTTQGNLDIVNFLPGIAPVDVSVRRNGDNLELRITGTEDMLVVERYFSPYARNSWYTYNVNMNKIEEFHFDDGTIWDIATIQDKARFITGTSGDDSITGFGEWQNVITAGAGNDVIYANSQGDLIDAGEGNDTVYGNSGNDRITGGVGNDILEGSTGNDTYIFAPGFGVDTIYDNDNGQGNSLDVVEFTAGIASEDVVVRRLSNDDLEITILGTSDKLTIQRFFSNYYRNSSWNTGTNSNAIEEFRFADGTTWDIAAIKDKVRFIKGTAGDDSISGFGDQQNIITAGDGNDTMYAGSALSDELYGEGGNDTLIGTWGSEKFDGGTGNDYMEGSAGDDIYVFGPGYGQDVIYDSNQGQGAGLDKVTFLAGIDPADVSVKRLSNSDLEITFAGTTDKLTIERYFSNYYKNSSWNTGADSNVVEELHFADGTIWTTATIKEKVRTMHGTENGETLQGFGDQQNLLYAGAGDDALYAGGMSGDKLYGEDGNDVLYGSWASETLDGGAGNDRMEGSAGDDTYIFGLGYGQDVIYDSNQGQGTNLDKVIFLEGINPSDVTAKRLSNSDLELTFAGSSDKLTIERYFSNYYKNSSWNTGTDSNAIEEFHFADNTVWDIDDIKAMVRTINGTENGEVLYGYEDADTITAGGGDDSVYAGYGNDVISGGSGDDALYGEDGNDVLDGGTGNDHLDGGYGDDTYIFSGTFGNDQINDYYGNDLVQFSDLGKDSLVFEQVGNALRITPGGSSDSVSIGYWYSYNDYKIETIKDASGNTISSSQVEQLIQAMASWSNDNNGMSWSQALSSNSQDVQNIVAQYWTAPTV